MIRRKNYFIKKAFQIKFLSGFVVLLVLGALLITGLFMYTSNNTLTTGYSGSALRVESTPNFFLVSLLLITLITVIGMGIAGMIIFILLSHRIAGPLYRFEKSLKDLASGDLTRRVNLRKTDQLAELNKGLNVLIESMDGKIGGIKKNLSDIEAILSKRDDPELIAKVKSKFDIIKKEIGRFKVS
jgi:methyl-accepting chemotaxis protein